MMRKVIFLLNEYKYLWLVLLLILAVKSSLIDWNKVPTGSMIPTILIGDFILVNKMAYDIRLPFTLKSLHRHAEPKRGDVIVFDRSGIRYVKRIIGMPGDVLSMKENVLTLNGQSLDYQFKDKPNQYEAIEELPGAKHLVLIDEDVDEFSHFETVTIPQGKYFVMGDNRNNSTDSRLHGLVARDDVVGKTDTVVISLDYEDNYLPREQRNFLNLSQQVSL
jgi:signal peptidase I